MTTDGPLFEVRDLAVAIFDPQADERRTEQLQQAAGEMGETLDGTLRAIPTGWVEVIAGMSFRVDGGEVLAVVGESGGGKSLSVFGSLRLLHPTAMVVRGTSMFAGEVLQDVVEKPAATDRARRKSWRKQAKQADTPQWRRLVGVGIGCVFQDALAAWDPSMMIGMQSGEALDEHYRLSQQEIQERVLDALGDVKLPKRAKYLSFVHEMSRGQAQRAMLAAALITAPDLLVADEPLSGLDAAVGAAILDLMRDMRRERGMGMIYITHDLATVASIADRVMVLYAGRVVEEADAVDLFARPLHPYTDGLLGSIPWPGMTRLRPIGGSPPPITKLSTGCDFADRCPHVVPACRAGVPELRPVAHGKVRCIRAEELTLEGART